MNKKCNKTEETWKDLNLKYKVKRSKYDVVLWHNMGRANDPENCVGSSLATGRSSHAWQVEGDGPVNNGYPGPPSWGLTVGLTTPPLKTHLLRIFYQSLGIYLEANYWIGQTALWAAALWKKT